MYWIFSLLGAALVGGLMVLLVNREFGRDDQVAAKNTSLALQTQWEHLKTVPLTAENVSTVKFSQALRGYNVDEVDAFLERVAALLEEQGLVAPTEKSAKKDSVANTDSTLTGDA